jgi:hypothetical protein
VSFPEEDELVQAFVPGWQFFKDHPYKVDPEPYQSLPATFPSYCKLM